MPLLHTSIKDEERTLPFTAGFSVREILDSSDLRVASACGGVGGCGRCLVRIETGTVNDPTANELTKFSPAQLRDGMRLACQVKPLGEVWLTVENPAPPSPWRSLAAHECSPTAAPSVPVVAASGSGASYGVAVDLGTTQIRLTLWDLTTGRRLAGRIGLNPQSRFGADVLSRLTAAAASRERAREISGLTRNAIGEALQDISLRESYDTRQISQVLIVGNTAMLALLTENNYARLLQYANWSSRVDCRLKDSTAWRTDCQLNAAANIEVVQPLAGFIGSDLLAGVLATQLTAGQAGSLLIDFGTNSEIALWDGEVLWVTSAAGGPAFEGSGISCGMPAEAGAIFRVDHGEPQSEFAYEVIGGGAAKGLCGSGLVDLMARLVESDKLKSNGRWGVETGDGGFPLMNDDSAIKLKGRDIDLFQRAKAAIGAGTRCLMQQAGLQAADLTRICVCGAFGQDLNIAHAQAIGLLPKIPAARIELCGNTALAGCELLLTSAGEEPLAAIIRETRVLNMSLVPEFEGLFIENLYLRPMSLE